MRQIPLIAVCVCTYKRPEMLRRCLQSLTKLKIPEGFTTAVVVVDNEPGKRAETIVERFAHASHGHRVRYTHEPSRGIAQARNAACHEASRLSASWIAFIDDDAEADEDWLTELMQEEYLNTPVLMGAVHYVYPAKPLFWAAPEDVKGKEGQVCKTAYTGNVRFRADILVTGLKFNERLALTGGEDNEFFATAYSMGFEIKRSLRAVVYETVHPARLTYFAQTYRAYWCAASEMRRLALTRGRSAAIVRKGHTIPLNFALAGLWFLAALTVGLVSREAFRDLALEGGKKLAKAAGRAAALVGHKPQPYKNTVGE